MPATTRSELLQNFAKGKIPTEDQFAALINSALNQADDGIVASGSDPLTIFPLPSRSDGAVLRFAQAVKNSVGGVDTPTAWLLKFDPPGTANPGLRFEDSKAVCALYLQSGGVVGINTNKPAATLDVNGTINASGLITAAAALRLNTSKIWFAGGTDPNHGVGYYGNATPFAGVAIDGPVLFGFSGGALGTNQTTVQKIALQWNSAGNVGIGTNTLGFPLGFANILGDKISLWGQSGNSYGFGIQGSLLQIHTDGSGSDIAFGYGSSAVMTETMRIKGNGNLIVPGIITPSASSTAANSPNTGIMFPNDPGGGSGDSAWIRYYPRTGESCTLEIGISNDPDDHIALNPSGNVGIGTLNPTRGRLDIVGTGSPQPNFSYGYVNKNGAGTSSATNMVYGIYCDNRIAAVEFNAFSDARIKDIQGRSDGAADLETLSRIEITNYTHKDKVVHNGRPHKKVIGQELEMVFPQSITRVTDVVPDIYQEAAVHGDWVMLATNLQAGERVRMIGTKDAGIHEVLEVRDNAFRTTFQPGEEKVFVYGREAKDFRTVDYDAISMLNVSATQELHRQVQRQSAEILRCKEQINGLEQRLAAVEAPVMC